MIQNRKQFFKIAVEVLVLVLGFFAAFLSVKAVFPGCEVEVSSKQNTQIHVFINQNDSIVNKLHEDVEHLSSLIEKMQTDTVIIEMRKPRVSE